MISMSRKLIGKIVRFSLPPTDIQGAREAQGDCRMTQQDEVDRNYEEFQKRLPELLVSHMNQYALMSGGKIVGFYSTSRDAMSTAANFLAGKPFSVQRVTDSGVDLGFFSHAMHVSAVQSNRRPIDSTRDHSP